MPQGQGVGQSILNHFLGKFFNPDGTVNQNQNFASIPNLINTIKSTQPNVTDDDLKTYLNKFTQAGYNVGSDFSVTRAPTGTAASPYVPAPPTPPNQVVPTNPNLPTDVPGQTIAGPTIDLNSDEGKIEQEAAREKQQGLDVLNQQVSLGQTGLSSLGDILQKQNQAQFNYDLPDIKEQLQGEGVYNSPSALANAVARESSLLGANTTAQLGQYGLGNIQLQQQGLGSILQNQQGLQQGGLQRQFSLADYAKQAQLAKDIGSASLPQAPSSFSSALTGGLGGAASGAAIGSAVPGIGPAVGAGTGGLIGLISGATKGGGK